MKNQPFKTVYLQESPPAVVILDQTRLPGETVYRALTTPEEIHSAIVRLEVRGAPAIGVAAALGLYVCACVAAPLVGGDSAGFRRELAVLADNLISARPTAVNLPWAIGRMLGCLPENGAVPALVCALREEALAILREDEKVCAAIGRFGAPLIENDTGVLTHCNAGALATAGMGTALAPVYTAFAEGRVPRVYCDETRPLLQGARLTAAELTRAGLAPTLLCDNMAASLMAAGEIDLVLTGCDRVARNGDAANKIGTLGVAILAKHFGVPFYICAPFSTIDPATPAGAQIPIEQRDGREVTGQWYKTPMAPEGVRVYNPAFDVTPAGLITGFITERGILRPGEIGDYTT